jgi:hypothetical protein
MVITQGGNLMDPITLAVTSALGGLGAKVINDAYQALKAALQHKYGVESDVVEAVNTLEKKPDSQSRQDVLQEEVAAVQADQVSEILKAAESLIAAVKSQPCGEDTVQHLINQNVQGDHNIFSGSGDVTVNR